MADETRKDIILSVKVDGSEASQGIDDVQGKLDNLNNTHIDKPFKSFRQEIKESINEAKRLGEQFGTNSKEYANALSHTAKLKDEFNDLNKSVAAFNPDNKLQALVSVSRGAIGALEGVSGAMAFIGVESEKAEETIKKLQGLMAFSNAIGDLKELYKGWGNISKVVQASTIFQKANTAATIAASTVMKLFGGSVDTTSKSFKNLKGAIAATGIGLLVVVIAEAVSYFKDLADAAEKAAEKESKAFELAEKYGELALKTNVDASKRREELDVARLKLAGKTEQEIFDRQKKGQEERLSLLQTEFNVKNDRYKKFLNHEITLTDEGLKELQESINKSNEEINKSKDERTKSDLEFQNKQKEEAEKKAKEAEAKKKQELEKAKALLDKETEQLKKHAEEVLQITDESIKEVAKAKLDDRQKELFDIDDSFNEKRKKVQENYDEDLKVLKDELKRKAITQEQFNGKVKQLDQKSEDAIVALEAEKGEKKLETEKKYNKLISDFINGYQESEYQKSRQKLIDDFDEKIKIADDKQKELLQKLKDEQLAKLDKTETLRKNTINTETTLVDVQKKNEINETDTPAQRIEKLEAVWVAEKSWKQAKFQQELEALGNNQEEIANLKAKHNLEVTEDEKAHTEARKELHEAEKESKMKMLDAVGSALEAASTLAGKHTVAGKAMAVASTTIQTYEAAMSAYKGMVKAIPGPWGIAAGVVAAAAAVATGVANVKKILAVQVPGKGGGSGGQVPSPTSAPTINSTQLNPSTPVQDVRVTNPGNQVVRAYISQRELNSNEDRSNFLNKLGTI